MKDYMTIYKEWLENPYFDEATKEELRAIEGDENEIKERFYMDCLLYTSITVSLDEIAAKVGELLETIHHDMFERAKAHRDSHTYVATTLDEMKEIAENKPGFIKAMWCGNQECEDKLKEVVGVTSRCIPFNQEHLADTCVCCGKPATKMVYWGKACLLYTSRCV